MNGRVLFIKENISRGRIMSQTSCSHIQSRISSGTLALIAVLGQTRDMLVPTDLTWNASPNMTRDVLYGCRFIGDRE